MALVNIVVLIWLVFFGLCLWFLACNELTSKQRQKIIDLVFDSPDWQRLRKDFHTVTYGEHAWAIFWLKNPMQLYPESLAHALNRTVRQEA